MPDEKDTPTPPPISRSSSEQMRPTPGPASDADAGAETKIYATEKQILEAARQISQKSTRLSQRQRIMKSLRESGIMASASVPVLLDSYRGQETSGRHDILDFLGHLLDTGADLSPHAAALGACLNETNTALREKVVTLLVRMGPGAQAAETAALGCTRNAMREMRLAGLRVLAAIGRACSAAAVARLQTLQASTPATDVEMREAIADALAAARGTDKQAIPPEEQEAREKVLALLTEAGNRELTPQILNGIQQRLVAMPERLVLRALFSCFSSPQPRVRAAAALLLHYHRRHLSAFLPILTRAFRLETDRQVKDLLGMLLSWALQDRRLKEEGQRPQATGGKGC
ncbi:MAG: hypothetical protein N3A66_05805 [Planctomycetota bacterium]|nr:hypothetical protein [Planctomycetota bacterium]